MNDDVSNSQVRQPANNQSPVSDTIPTTLPSSRNRAETTMPIDVIPNEEGRTGMQQVELRSGERMLVQLREEQLYAVKEWVEAGAILVRKGVETSTQSIPVEVLHEEVAVERVAVNRVLAQGETAVPREEGNVLIVPVVHEELVVMKRLVVKEELHITKRRVSEQREVSDTVRRETLTLDSEGMAQVPTRDDMPRT